jgi:hypothetical protein
VKWLNAATSAVCTAGLALHGANIYHASRDQLISMVAAVAATSLIGAARTSWWEHTSERRARFREDVAQVLRGAAVITAEVTGKKVPSVGASAFVVSRGGLLWRQQYLRRIGRQRFASFPPPSNVVWTRGKGVIGRCWADRKPVVKDFTKIAKRHRGCSRDQFEKLKDDVRLGLNYTEWNEMIGKYGVVLAVPMTASPLDGKIIGVLALDLQEGTEHDVTHNEVRKIAYDAAASIAKIIRGDP